MNDDVNCGNGSGCDINDDDNDVKDMPAYCQAPSLEENLQ